MVINFLAMTFKMFLENIFYCRPDIDKGKDFLFFLLPLKATEHECTLNFRNFLKIPTAAELNVTSYVDNGFLENFAAFNFDQL